MACGINVDMIKLPIWKIWKSDQLPISEIGLTYLAGSMVFDGGLNGTPAGELMMEDNNRKFERAMKEVFLDRVGWVEDAKRQRKLDQELLDALTALELLRENPTLVEDELKAKLERATKLVVELEQKRMCTEEYKAWRERERSTLSRGKTSLTRNV
jgi:hypothetical protein